MTKCTDPACAFEATHVPRLLLYAFTGATPGAMFFNLPRCRAHAITEPAQLVTDDTWSGIVVACVSTGKLAPKRDLSVVEMIPIKSHQAREYFRLLERGRGQSVTTGLPLHSVN